jgi:hypothetical protein
VSEPAGQAVAGRHTGTGPGRLLIACYAFFALAAGARAGWQLATRFSEAPAAYLLSLLAAALYLVAAVGLARSGPAARRITLACCAVELAGVLTVGTASLLAPEVFPRATVWSGFGVGYAFVPLVLPVLGLLWLRHTRARAPSGLQSARLAGPRSAGQAEWRP